MCKTVNKKKEKSMQELQEKKKENCRKHIKNFFFHNCEQFIVRKLWHITSQNFWNSTEVTKVTLKF